MSSKRALDIVGSLVGLLLTAPISAVIAAVIRARLGAPVLFRQVRPGRYEEPFTLVKFRTMRAPSYDGEDDEARLSTLGHVLRNTSLDELPELWNVLRGDMSLVGPRPLLMEYLPLYDVRQARRHEVRPGLTGWAQVNGRNAPSWEEKLEMDVWYVENRSLALDLQILSRTVLALLTRKGINRPGHATSPRFTGAHGQDTRR